MNGNTQKKPISKVLNCNCIDFMKTIPDKFFDLSIADPPYGINRAGHNGVIAKNPRHNWKRYEFKAWDEKSPNRTFFDELLRVSKNTIIWGANYYPQFLSRSMGWIVWDKGQHGLTMSDGELAYTSFDRALRIVTINRGTIAQDGAIHPTQKPVALYCWLLENYAIGGG